MVRFKRAQSSLEMAMVLIVTTLLITVVIKSWSWFSENMTNRMQLYQESRLTAGQAGQDSKDTAGMQVNYSQSKLQFFHNK
ncbi:MAG: hypothetical protein NC936_03215, partial [Candidatus Omnitrophica bacterium]|nr:hypothetical protein [Candidatus Omnitrophota bacterium]